MKQAFNVRFIDEEPDDYGHAIPSRGWDVHAEGGWEAAQDVFKSTMHGTTVLVSDWRTGANARVVRRGEPRSPEDGPLSSAP